MERHDVEVPGDVVALAVRRARRSEEGEALVEEILFNITLSPLDQLESIRIS